MFKYLDLQSSSMLLLEVFPKRLFGNSLFQIRQMFLTSLVEVPPSFSCIFRPNCLFTEIAWDLISDACSPADPFISCVARETSPSLAMLSFASSWHRCSQNVSIRNWTNLYIVPQHWRHIYCLCFATLHTFYAQVTAVLIILSGIIYQFEWSKPWGNILPPAVLLMVLENYESVQKSSLMRRMGIMLRWCLGWLGKWWWF